MLLVEAYAKYHANGHLARPTLLLAFSMFAIGGFSHGRIAAWGGAEAGELRVTDDGVSVPGRFFSRTTLRWEDIAEKSRSAPTRRASSPSTAATR